MGVVFEGRDLALDRPVAIKVLRPEAATAAAAARFLREARLLARLRHPNVVPVHQAGETDGLFWFVMDLVEGETLATRTARSRPSTEETLAVARDLLEALGAAHELGIIHRDLKPANVFLDGRRALLADFGIARSVTTSTDGVETLTQEVIGTPAYMAPEQLAGEPVSPATDLYALGLVLYECLTGRRWPPLQAPQTGDWSGVPAAVVPVIQRAVMPSPQDRWQSAAEFRDALFSAPRGRRRWVLGTGAAAALTVAVLWVRPTLPGAEPGRLDAPGREVVPAPGGPAARAWNEAERMYGSGRWREADSLYLAASDGGDRCLACTFRRLDVGRWLGRPVDSAQVEVVRAGAGRFAPAWQALIDAVFTPPGPARLAALEAVTAVHRDFGLARYFLGTELFNRGSLFGYRRRDAVDALDLATRLDTTALVVPPLFDLALASIAEGDTGLAGASIQRVSTVGPALGLAGAQRALAALAFAFRFTPDGPSTWEQVRVDPGIRAIPELPAGPRLLVGLGTPAGAVALGRAFEQGERERPLQRSGLIAQMFGNVALGRLEDARAAGARLAAHSPGVAQSAFALTLEAAAVLLDPDAAGAEVRRVIGDLDRLAASAQPPPLRREAAWLLTLGALRLGQSHAAARHAAILTSEAPPARRRSFAAALQLAHSGLVDSALAVTAPLAEQLALWDTWERTDRSPVLRAAVRLHRGRWLAQLGSPEAARQEYRWHQHFHLPEYPVDPPLAAEGDWAFGTLASWEQAVLLDSGRHDADVCAGYRAVVERWSDGDPSYRARADSARRRLEALACAAP